MLPLELIAAVFTPFAPDGELDLACLDKYAQFLLNQGVKGVFVGGTTGEGMSMTVAERMRLSRGWACVLGEQRRLRLIIHVGHACLRDACELARHAEALGADGIAAISPIFFSPASVESSFRVHQQVAAAAPDTSYYAYHFPAMSRDPFPASALLPHLIQGIPTFRGFKFTHDDLADFARCTALSQGRHELFFGRDELLLPALHCGALEAVGSTYNFAAPLYLLMEKALRAGDLAEAQRLQDLAARGIRLMGGLPGAKEVMARCGIPCGAPRPPLEPLDTAAGDQLYAALGECGYLAAIRV